MKNRQLRYEQLEHRRVLTAGVLQEAGDIVAEIQRWKELAFGRDSNAYVAPSQTETAQFGSLAVQLRDGDVAGAATNAAALNYEIVEYSDTNTGTTFYQLREELIDGAPTRGWGTYFVNLGFHQNSLIEVPHPISDTSSWDIGAKVFRDSGARGFLMAGAHRHANGAGTADVAHLEQSVFQSVHEVWNGFSGETTAWQIHGFALSKHDGDPGEDLFPAGTDLVVSNGDGGVSQEVVEVDAAFEAQGFQGYSYNTLQLSDPLNMLVNDGVDGTTFASLAATTNVQGNATRALGGTFVHLEFEQGIRFDATNRDLASTLIGESLSESTFHISAATIDDSNPDVLKITVDFNSSVDSGTLNPSDMSVNGVVAESVTQTDNETASFEFPSFAAGSYTATMSADSVADLSQTGLSTYHLPFELTVNAPPITKFFVADTADDSTFEYSANVDLVESYSLGAGNNAPRGAAADATGNTVWVVDNDDFVYVYDAAGSPLGKWDALGLSQPEGIATDGEDIWIVDRGHDRVHFFDDAASLRAGNQSADASFPLNDQNKSARGITTDGQHIWTVNAARSFDRVFKYTLAGSLVGSWTLDANNSNPRGITTDPLDSSHLWIVDNGSDAIYQYSGGGNRTSGSQAADAVFALEATNSNPQGIADPPPTSVSPWLITETDPDHHISGTQEQVDLSPNVFDIVGAYMNRRGRRHVHESVVLPDDAVRGRESETLTFRRRSTVDEGLEEQLAGEFGLAF